MGPEFWQSTPCRRDFLRGSVKLALGGTAFLLAACGDASATTETTWQRIRRTKVVTFGYSNEPPLSIRNPDGSVTGHVPDILRAAMAPYGVGLNPVLGEFPSLIPGLLAKRFDVVAAGTRITPQRCAQISFGNPDSVLVNALEVKKGNPLNLHSLADIAKHPKAILGIVSGSAYIPEVTAAGIPESRTLQFSDNAVAPNAILTGRVDAFLEARATAMELLEKPANAGVELADPYIPRAGEKAFYQGLGFRKEDNDFREAYNVELAKLKSNGELLKIAQRYHLALTPAPAGLTAEEVCKGGG